MTFCEECKYLKDCELAKHEEVDGCKKGESMNNDVRLIDANALTKIIERELYYAENSTIHKILNYCLGAIQNAPTVSPEKALIDKLNGGEEK